MRKQVTQKRARFFFKLRDHRSIGAIDDARHGELNLAVVGVAVGEIERDASHAER